jgi:hypothetical protein
MHYRHHRLTRQRFIIHRDHNDPRLPAGECQHFRQIGIGEHHPIAQHKLWRGDHDNIGGLGASSGLAEDANGWLVP